MYVKDHGVDPYRVAVASPSLVVHCTYEQTYALRVNASEAMKAVNQYMNDDTEFKQLRFTVCTCPRVGATET